MRKLGLVSAIVLLTAASNAMALTAALKNSAGGASSILVPFGVGGTIDLLIEDTRGGGDPTMAGVQMDFVADAAGLTIVGTQPVGTGTNAGTGTRYNDPEWFGDNSNSLDPDAFDGPMTANVSVGIYGGAYQATGGVWATPVSTQGHLVINYAALAPNTVINIIPTNILGVDANTFDNVEGTGIAFTIGIPEPASALLLLAALPFMRRRRTA